MIQNGNALEGLEGDPTETVRRHLRELERMVVTLPVNTKDQEIAARRIRGMIGDQLAELSWWRPRPEGS